MAEFESLNAAKAFSISLSTDKWIKRLRHTRIVPYMD